MKRLIWTCLTLAVIGGVVPQLRANVLYSVTVNTTPLAGTMGYMAFDLLGGNPLQNNTATISTFASTATLGSSSTSGDVTGTLLPGPLNLKADQFFNEWLQAVTFASGLTTFTLNLTTNFPGVAPDSFSFFLLDTGFNPYATSDPSGANSLFAIDLVGAATSPQVYTSRFATATVTPVVVTGAPEPGTVSLVLLAALIGYGCRRRKSRCG